MQTAYFTDRLFLNVVSSNKAQSILDFYLKNKEFLEPHEPLRANNFYTLNFHKANLNCEYNAFIRHTYVRFWLYLRQNPSTPIGSICFSNILRGAFLSCMLGYKLDKDYCGNGYMYEALNYIIPVVCSDLSLHRVEAMVMPDNTPSINLLNRLHFMEEGYLNDYALIQGKWQDHILYTYIYDNSRSQ